jgi:hypothetical protein
VLEWARKGTVLAYEVSNTAERMGLGIGSLAGRVNVNGG